jgi:hypothetical protein
MRVSAAIASGPPVLAERLAAAPGNRAAGRLGDHRHRRGQHLAAAALNAARQARRVEGHRPAQAFNRRCLDHQRRVGGDHVVVQPDRRVEPLQPGQAPEVADAAVLEHFSRHVQRDPHRARLGALRAQGDRALVAAAGVLGDLHAEPQRADLALPHGEFLGERPA